MTAVARITALHPRTIAPYQTEGLQRLGHTMPLALVLLAVYRLHLTIRSIESWLPLLWAVGAPQ